MRRDKFEAVLFILVALSAFAAPVRAEEPASGNGAEPERTTTADASYRASEKADPQVAVTSVRTARKEDGKGGITGAALTGSFSFNPYLNPEATSHNIFLPAAKAGLEVFGGNIKHDDSGESTNTGIVRVTASRDLLLGESWAAIVAAGVQISGATGKAPVGTLAHLPIQQGLAVSATALIEGGVGSLSLYNNETKLIGGLRLEEVLQACQRLDHEEANFICLSLKSVQRVGREIAGQIDASVMYAYKIDGNGSQKAYLFIAPAVTASAITAGGNADHSKDVRVLEAGGRIGVTF